MLKKDLRLYYKKLRSQLTEDDKQEKSLLIANQLLQLPIWNKVYYHIFMPITEQNEVDTNYILQILMGKDKEIVISKSDFETQEMTHYLLTDNTKFIKNKYNISEPINGLEVPISAIDVVFVPLLSFDNQGNRVGYGKGFYDKFLAKCNSTTIKIGLSYFEPAIKIEDISETDIGLNYGISPQKTYHFSGNL